MIRAIVVAFRRSLPPQILVSLLIVTPCIISLAMGKAENILTVEGLAVTINLVIAVILLAGFFLSANHTLAFVHVTAIWLILIFAQIAKLSSDMILEGYYFYPAFKLSEIIVANLSIAIWLIVFTIAYVQTYRFVQNQKNNVAVIGDRTVIFGVLFAIAALSYLYIRLGGVVATRAAFDESFSAGSAIEGHLIEYPLRAIPFYAVGACILAFGSFRQSWQRKIIGAVVTMLLVVATMIINNPIAASRSFLGVTAIGLLYVVALRKSRSNLPLLAILCFGIFFVLPLDFGRTSLELQDAIVDLEWSFEKVFLNDLFSTFESVPAAVKFIEDNGTTFWWQFIGNLLFFVPRLYWPEKPIGSGAFMVESQFGSSVFSNVSCAAPCEGLINFGLLGVTVLAMLFGVVLGYMDKKRAWTRSLGVPDTFTLFYAFFVGHVFFITRGDLLSPLAIMVSMSIAYMVLRVFGMKKPVPQFRNRGF